MAIRIEMIGNLGHDAGVKEINGRECLSFDVAPSRVGRDGGDTMWVSCLYYNTRVAEWLTRGRQVFVRGDYRDRIYTGRDGKARIDRSVMVTELELLGGGERAEENPVAGSPARAPQPQAAYGHQYQNHQNPPQPAPPAGDDDDLPF